MVGFIQPIQAASLPINFHMHGLDFDQYLDSAGYNWYTNSVHAVEAAIAYAKTLTPQYAGINENSWGDVSV